ncbi:MAG: hypothetical protein NDJ94_12305 [Vicinamibacteria bacterium]|nr:hypothetical protein [Vicinamibacteria bacterium]
MKRLLAAALVATLVAPVATAQETSLAEAARREKERRKAQKKDGAAATTFTDEDLKADREGSGTVSSPAAAGTRAARPGAAPPAAGGGEAEGKAWFNRAETLRKSIAAAEERIPKHEQRIAELRNDNAPNPDDLLDPNRLQKREAEIHRLLAEIEAAQAEVVRLKQALSDLEDEARAKGIPPGWLEGRFSG